MKKLAALALTLLLALSLTAAYAQTYTAGTYYTVEYSDDLTLDNTSYTEDNTEDSSWLFMLSNDQYIIDAGIDVADGYEGFSLYNASEADRAAYQEDMLDAYADENIKLIQTLDLPSGVPFYIYSIEDSDGDYYYAETIANGNSVNFCCYYADAGVALDDALLANLVKVLNTFQPVKS